MNITISRTFEAPPARLFQFMTDVPGWADRIEGITRVEVLTDGPIGVGTRFRETRIMFKRECTEELEFTTFEPDRGYTIECESCGCHYITTTELIPEGSGTTVQMKMEARPLTFMAKLMSPLGGLMAGGLKKCLEKDLDSLKQSIEDHPSEMATA